MKRAMAAMTSNADARNGRGPTKPQFRRYARYREMLEGRPRSLIELAEAVEVEEKTVRRDLRFLIGEWGWETRYRADTRKWHSDGSMPLAILSLTDEEALALLVAAPAVREYGGPFGPALRSAVEKIIRCLDAPVPLDPA
ncbi:MAG TPA: hypothetical protein VGS41_00660, partial [Chthonomonadales bacterium]|nr:hypothetical protein [Chthonomonadales bacterium]